jgi:hypothetical protein
MKTPSKESTEALLKEHRELQWWLVIELLAYLDGILLVNVYEAWYAWIVPGGLIVFIGWGEWLAYQVKRERRSPPDAENND